MQTCHFTCRTKFVVVLFILKEADFLKLTKRSTQIMHLRVTMSTFHMLWSWGLNKVGPIVGSGATLIRVPGVWDGPFTLI